MELFGPNLTTSEVEAIGIEVARQNPAVPQVAFAYANAAWLSLKQKMKPGDQLREYRLGPSGGYAATRKACFVGFFGTWVS